MSFQINRRALVAGAALAPFVLSGAFAAAGSPARRAAVEKLIDTVRSEYQDEVLANTIADAVAAKLASGAYDTDEPGEAFAARLSQDMLDVVGDKHLAVMSGMTMEEADLSSDTAFQTKINFGVQQVKRLPGNIGLVELNFFPNLSFGDQIYDRYAAALTLVKDTRALIVDVRQHMGGEPACIAYFVSYFFERPKFLVNEIRNRRAPTESYYTTETPRGPRYGEARPMVVLTSGNTFSGGEEFAYDLQNLKRARVVGQVTGGGANPNKAFMLGDDLVAMIPTGAAVNPITKTNWEGVGVKPDVETAEDKTFNTGHRLAAEAALAQATDEAVRKSLEATIADIPA